MVYTGQCCVLDSFVQDPNIDGQRHTQEKMCTRRAWSPKEAEIHQIILQNSKSK